MYQAPTLFSRVHWKQSGWLGTRLKKSKAVSEAPVENKNDTETISDNTDSEISHDPEAVSADHSLALEAGQAAALTRSADNDHTSNIFPRKISHLNVVRLL